MKDNKFSKIITYIVTAIAVVGIILLVRVLMAGEDAVENDVAVQNSVVSPLVSFSQYLLYGVVIVTLVLSMWGLFKNPENSKEDLIRCSLL